MIHQKSFTRLQLSAVWGARKKSESESESEHSHSFFLKTHTHTHTFLLQVLPNSESKHSNSFLFFDPCKNLAILNKTCMGSVKGMVATFPFSKRVFLKRCNQGFSVLSGHQPLCNTQLGSPTSGLFLGNQQSSYTVIPGSV